MTKRTRRPRILVNSPYIALASDKKHVGTRVQFSKSTDFNDTSMMVVDMTVYSPDDILNIKLKDPSGGYLEVDLDDVYYYRYCYIFDVASAPTNNPDLYTQEPWSVIASVYGDQDGFRFDHIVVSTPVLSVNDNVGNVSSRYITVNAEGFNVIIGSGEHKYTSWYVLDTDGNTIFSREKDEDNLTSITLPYTLFKQGKVFTIKARFITNTNGESNLGTYVYNSNVIENEKFTLTPVLPFQKGRSLFYRLKLMAPYVTHLTVKIFEDKGDSEVLKTTKVFNNLTSSITLPSDDLTVGLPYKTYAYLTFNHNGKTYNSSTIFINSFTLKAVDMAPIIQDAKYPGRYSLLNDLVIGAGVFTSRELKNGTILLSDNSGQKFRLYGRYGNTIRGTGIEIDLPLPAAIDIAMPYINVLPMYDDKILLNYTAYETSSFKASVWALYSVDLVNNTWKLLTTAQYRDEIFSTSMCSSACVSAEGCVYYIPAVKNTTGYDDHQADSDLPMYKLSITESAGRYSLVRDEVVTSVIPGVTRHLTMCPLNVGIAGNEEFLILGGTDSNRTSANATGNQTGLFYYSLTNLKVYKFSTNNQQVTEIINGSLPPSFPVNKYALSVFKRGDGKFVIFNNSLYGPNSNDSSSYVLDLSKATPTTQEPGYCLQDNNDSRVDLPFRSTIIMQSGDFLRLSHSDLAYTKVLIYPHNNLTDYVDTDVTININKNLVIPIGTTLTIENPYLYDSIIIEGDAPDNTGIMRWTDVTTPRVADYRDKFITRDTIVSQAEDAATPKEHLWVLDGVSYKVK